MKVPVRGFDLTKTPDTTAGAYSAGDIIGGLMEFAIAQGAGELVLLQELQVMLKTAVTPVLRVIIFDEAPASTTTTDNAAYSLAAADAFKVRAVINLSSYDTHGTPKSTGDSLLTRPIRPKDAAGKVFVLVVTDTGISLGSVLDVQVRLAGLR